MRIKIIYAAVMISLVVLAGIALLHASGSDNKLPVTGQTFQYSAGDDGALKKGNDFPSTRFCDNGDNTVTDNMTGLMWTKDANLSSGFKSWDDALIYISGLNNANSGTGTYGYNDWRLPNVNEFKTLVHYAQSNSATWLVTQGFTNVNQSNYWSSTTYASITTQAWYFHLNGIVDHGIKTLTFYVWPVRGGQK